MRRYRLKGNMSADVEYTYIVLIGRGDVDSFYRYKNDNSFWSTVYSSETTNNGLQVTIAIESKDLPDHPFLNKFKRS